MEVVGQRFSCAVGWAPVLMVRIKPEAWRRLGGACGRKATEVLAAVALGRDG